MKELITVFLGSGLGGMFRYGLGKWVNSLHTYSFPLGTFVVNIIACFILGFVIGLADNKQMLSPTVRLFLAVGFCGGFSTFSSFSNENLMLLQQGQFGMTLFYTITSLIVCLIMSYAGFFVVSKI